MKPGIKNSYNSLSEIEINKKIYKIFSLSKAEKNIAGVVSQVLILGSIDTDGKVTLVHPSQKADDGLPIA